MAEYLPSIVTKLDGDTAGLAAAFAEAETMADKYGQTVEKTTEEHGKQAGKKGGKGLVDEFEKNLGEGAAKLKDERGKFRSALSDATDEAGKTSGKNMASRFWDSFTSRSTSGFNQLSGSAPTGMVQWLVGAAAVAAPAIGAAINAGVLLGVGGGGIAAGLVGAAQDPRVKNAWHGTFDTLWSDFQRASQPFVGPLLREATSFTTMVQDAMPGVERAFERAQPYVDRLFVGINGLIREIGPGFSRAFDAALPVIGALADALPSIGHGISNFLDSMARGGPGAVQFMRDFATAVAATLTWLGLMVEGLSKVYEVSRSLGQTGLVGWLLDANNSGDKTTKSFQKLGEGADAAATGIDHAKKSLSDFISEALKTQDADIALARGLQEVAKSFHDNGQSIDINTQKGLANRSALQSQIETIAQQRQAMIEQGLQISYVNNWTGQQIQRMRDAAVANGGNKASVDQLVEAWKRMLQLPSDKTLTTRQVTFIDTYTGGNAPRSLSGQRVAYRHGGVFQPVMAAQSGLLTSGGITREQSRPLIMSTEAGTGKEGIVPRDGISDDRFYSLVSEIAGWRGMQVSPPGGGGTGGGGGPRPGAGTGQTIVIKLQVDGRTFHEQVVLPSALQYKNQTGVTGF